MITNDLNPNNDIMRFKDKLESKSPSDRKFETKYVELRRLDEIHDFINELKNAEHVTLDGAPRIMTGPIIPDGAPRIMTGTIDEPPYIFETAVRKMPVTRRKNKTLKDKIKDWCKKSL